MSKRMILSAGFIIVRKNENTGNKSTESAGKSVLDKWLFLILRAYKNWDFPKGIVEEGEDPFEAAIREVNEETGIKNLRFISGKEYVETEPYSGGKKIARYYLAETDEKEVHFSINPEIGMPEHHEYRWVNFSSLKKLLPPRLQKVADWAKEKLVKLSGKLF